MVGEMKESGPKCGRFVHLTRIRGQMNTGGGAEGIRTPGLLIANETRYQLRHSPLRER
jgi:hypothetical protein